jgi:hypothetical protein
MNSLHEFFAQLHILVYTVVKKFALQHIYGFVRIILHGYWSCKPHVVPQCITQVLLFCISMFGPLLGRGRTHGT